MKKNIEKYHFCNRGVNFFSVDQNSNIKVVYNSIKSILKLKQKSITNLLIIVGR
jgi:hypothetical protein